MLFRKNGLWPYIRNNVEKHAGHEFDKAVIRNGIKENSRTGVGVYKSITVR